MTSVLDAFHPAIKGWFGAKFAAPTGAQEAAWPVIADGEHALITAPTGSGKTLTAFLWSLHKFACGDYEVGATRVLYVSPLKALNNDIQRNLLAPLAELCAAGEFPELRVATRSGDTSSSERTRLLRRPPEILITTPESLALMLSTRNGQRALGTVETLILDEVHALVDNRRGVQLMTSIERLAELAGEFQRVALSATVTPLEPIAAYLAGRRPEGGLRPMRLVNASAPKDIELAVRYPEHAREALANGKKIWEPLTPLFKEHTVRNTSTLFFTNSRRLAEKITLKINTDEPDTLAYAHHGSLARELRAQVEANLKAGSLKAIVATNSLEMGIDIGALDEVVMVQAPMSVASALQRIGRAGHQVGATSRSTLYPTHANDFLESAVLADCVDRRDIESLTPMTGALDVLAQVIISITAFEPRSVEEVYDLVRRSGPYLDLSREQFDLVIDMLAGRYAGSRVRELKPRISFDRIKGEIAASRGAVLAMYNSGGTIPDRGYYHLRHQDNGAQIGELDEEFVWEATVGDTFTLGTQAWQIHRITHNDVFVRRANSASNATPFWRAEAVSRSWHFSEQITEFLGHAEHWLADKDTAGMAKALAQRGFDEYASAELIDYLQRQREATRTALPDRTHILVEEAMTGPGGYRGPSDVRQTVIHTFWGDAVNRPWALALTALWRERFPGKPEIHSDNNAIVVQHRGAIDLHDLLWAVNADNLLPYLRQSLEGSGYFGARFRECAGRALLLTRNRFNQRLPLWMTRLQAKKLMSSVRDYGDFPVLLETWRTCLNDDFELPVLQQLLTELHNGEISWELVQTKAPSPFAADLSYNQIQESYMYADDTPEEGGVSALSDDAISLALAGVTERPKVRADVIDEFIAKRQRRAAGYAPEDAQQWAEWLKERLLIPASEWPQAFDPTLLAELEAAGGLRLRLGDRVWYTHAELTQLWQQQLGGDVQLQALASDKAVNATPLADPRDLHSLCLEMLSFYGPLTQAQVTELLPLVPDNLTDAPELITGALREQDTDTHLCDAQNYEILLRMQRAARRVSPEPAPLTAWPAYVAQLQGFDRGDGDNRDNALLDMLEQLRCYSAPVSAWVQEFLPARAHLAADNDLDQTLSELGMQWQGTGREIIAVGYPEELDLLEGSSDESPNDLIEAFVDPNAGYSFGQIAEQLDMDGPTLNAQWWPQVWAGRLSADSLTPLRKGLLQRYELSNTPSRSRRRLQRSLYWPGYWRLRERPGLPEDPLTELEDAKERARMLLDRYGILTRELANREGGNLRWARLFKALRVMELAGEIIAGYYFEGFSGPQFATPTAISRFIKAQRAQTFWLCAHDPAAPCGLGIDWAELPARRLGNYLVFHNAQLACVIENNGKRLRLQIAADDPDIDRVLHPLERLAQRHKRIVIDTVNDQPIADSPYLEPLSRVLRLERDHRRYSFAPSNAF